MNAVMPLSVECFHCGLPLPADAHWQVEIDGHAQNMCCPGCQAVAQAIVAAGLDDYYRERSSYADKTELDTLTPPELLLYDAPNDDDGGAADGEASFSVEGIRCAACVWLIERRLTRLPGVQSAALNVATEKLHARWDRSRCKTSDILRALRDIGYRAYPYDPARHEAQLRRAGKTLFRQLFVAGLCMMQVMMYAAPTYFATDLDAEMAALLRWASLLLTVPAVCYSALPFFRGAWHDVRNRRAGMDVPVALGIAAAFVGSAVATWRGSGDVYFDSVTMFIFLLLGSRYLELQSRRKAAASLERLQHALPPATTHLPRYPSSYDTETIAPAQLQVGDVIMVKPGEAIAADGILLAGEAELDLSLLTGESRPQHMRAGDTLLGGAINVSQAVLLRVTKTTRDSTLSNLVRLIEQAGMGKPQLAMWADKVAAWFVAGLLLLTVLVFALWYMIEPTRAWSIAIALLVVSCPCALSLATPTALAAASDSLLRRGVLVVQGHVLETLHRATHVIFDKTGTLTEGRPVLQRVQILGALPEPVCLGIAASLEIGSAHPLARAITAAAQIAAASTSRTSDCRHTAGSGMEGMIDGRRYRLGSRTFVAELAGLSSVSDADEAAQVSSTVYLGADGAWLARFELADALRADAIEVVRYFQRQGKQVVLLSGDRQHSAQRVATALGIAASHGDHLPAQKLDFVQALQQGGAVVAMVGDGINDAAVLRAADVSFAMGSGAALAQTHADTVLLSGRLGSLVDTAATATRAMRVVRQNLTWATLYNLLAIPAAALGLLSPWLSGVGMALSSALVVLNALRLRRLPAHS
ncbi:MAG: heavy metal translocating P-type ATPase [Proteobacteria bacterium]|nr:heavy metal translocating P-type ATPase [Pseudomonadota bacterium]